MLTTGRRYHAQRQRLAALAVRQTRRAPDVTRALTTLAVYQATAASLAVEHGTAALVEQGVAYDGPRIATAAFTVDPGTASILDEVETTRQFDLIVASLVADSGRSAMGVFTASRGEEYGHIRTLTPPSCSRCTILAGRWYRWSAGFERHPGCDCGMMPGPRSAAEHAPDPMDAFEKGEIGSHRTMPDGTRRFEQGISKAEVQAIKDGADISQVVNTHRGMTEVNFMGRRLKASTEGTTRYGLASRARTGRNLSARLTPESIYRVADDHADAIRMLKLHGYILP